MGLLDDVFGVAVEIIQIPGDIEEMLRGGTKGATYGLLGAKALEAARRAPRPAVTLPLVKVPAPIPPDLFLRLQPEYAPTVFIRAPVAKPAEAQPFPNLIATVG